MLYPQHNPKSQTWEAPQSIPTKTLRLDTSRRMGYSSDTLTNGSHTMKTPQELARMFDAGVIDELVRECLRYGAILADSDDPESLTRWQHVWHAGRVWELEHVKGECRGIGWKPDRKSTRLNSSHT